MSRQPGSWCRTGGIGVLALIAACNGGSPDVSSTTGPPPPSLSPPSVSSVTVLPSPATALVGGTLQLWPLTKDSAGDTLTGRPVTWASSDTTVAAVSATGLVMGAGAGSATITATSERKTATTALTVIRLALASVVAGQKYTCGVATNGVAFCWGANYYHQLGNGPAIDAFVPSAVWGGLTFTAVSVQYWGGCGLTTGGSAFCWGTAGEPTASGGALSGGHTDTAVPVAVVGGHTFTAVSDFDASACGLQASGAAYCWGWNRYGQLGTGDETDRSQPTAVTGGLAFTTLSHSCGVTAAGQAYCWGTNGSGEIGAPTSNCSTTPLGGQPVACSPIPVAVSGGLSFASISAGIDYTCGLTTGAAVYCWGAGSTTPAAVSHGLSFAAITTGVRNGCGLTTDGAALCWAAGDTTLVAVPGGLSFATISTGGDHTCGLTTGGVAYCWGSNSHGQLGDGTQNPSSVPVKVFGQP